MADQGVFAVHRGVFDHPMFAPEPYTEREAWLWMLSAAAWADKRIRVGKAIFDLKRGQLAFATRFIAEKWQWAHSKVVRFLKRLKTDTMIGTQATRDATLITICNYDEYQFGRNAAETQIETQSDTQPERQRNKEEETNNQTKKDSEANASGAEAPTDHRKRLFDQGLATLGRLTGKGPDACRSFVGKCLKAASDDAITVLGLIEDAERNRVVDPSAWIVARLKPSTGPPVRASTVYQQRQVESREILDEINQSIARRGSREDFIALRNDTGDGREIVRSGPGLDVIDIPAKCDRSGG